MAVSKINGNTDTGWITLNSTYNVYYRVKNDIVCVVMRLLGQATPTDGMTLATLPNRYCPTVQMVMTTHNLRGNLMIKETGEVIISANPNQTLNGYMGVVITYPI